MRRKDKPIIGRGKQKAFPLYHLFLVGCSFHTVDSTPQRDELEIHRNVCEMFISKLRLYQGAIDLCQRNVSVLAARGEGIATHEVEGESPKQLAGPLTLSRPLAPCQAAQQPHLCHCVTVSLTVSRFLKK